MPSPARTPQTIPSWLAEPEDYHPGSDRDGYVSRSLLSMTSVLARLRFDDGTVARFSPSPVIKLVLCLVTILLTSLARNYLFVLVMLACLLARDLLLPQRALTRVMGGALSAAAFALVVMAPAALIGQPRAGFTLAGKAFVCTGIALTWASTTPHAQLTASLRAAGMPSLAIMAITVALASIVRLGETAAEALAALTLRSVGRNRHKMTSVGGVGGVVLVKASLAAQATHDAMRCRGFDGEIHGGAALTWKRHDILWLAGLVVLVLFFLFCQGAFAHGPHA